ncbi:UbiA family prenyltransferase [Nocardioides sp. YIM 152588]|uniref:UbiA family prenyltransferase n=1 Tax=Nocardioides sp. YIM 152588 TaxID=3158259 RepID=UPI0032E45F15
MGNTQRWRRGRTAGEGSGPDEDPTEAHDGAPAGGPSDAGAPTTDITNITDVAAYLEAVSVSRRDFAAEEQAQAGLAPTAVLDEEPDEEPDAGTAEPDGAPRRPTRGDAPVPAAYRRSRLGWFATTSPREWVGVTLLQAAHLKQAVATALAMGLAAVIAGRPAREAGVIVATVLVGQTILGWHNDITDQRRDERHHTPGKPLADGRLLAGTAWYAIIVATLLLVPLAITTGVTAGCIYLASVAVGMLGNLVLRTGPLSFWSWAVSFAMLPAYLSYGGWGGQAVGSAPQPSIVVLAALLGVGVHFALAVWGLVADHEDGWTYLPLRLGLRLGASRVLALTSAYLAVVVVLLLVFGARDGLTR